MPITNEHNNSKEKPNVVWGRINDIKSRHSIAIVTNKLPNLINVTYL